MNVLDLFCGCGGLSRGFQSAGFNISAAFDSWEPAIATYNANNLHRAVSFDLGQVTSFVDHVRHLPTDLVVGGPPCQDFSSAGAREEKDRANLTRSFSEIVAQLRPNFFVMENVARTRNSRTYAMAREIFKSADYGLTEIVLDASLCGVPQSRKRFFVIGALQETDNFMNEILTQSQSGTPLSVKDFLGKEIDVEHYYRHPRNYSRRAVYSVNEPSATIRGVSRPVPKGYKGHRCDSIVIHDELRALTTRERARLQTFPADYKWIGSKTDVEQMIGNAVPVNLGFFVANCLMNYLELKNQENWAA